MLSVTLLLLTIFAAALWFRAMKARELAISACADACRAYDVQLLDATVALCALRVVRARDTWRLRRVYRFSFSHDGYDRASGTISLDGMRVEAIYFSPPAPPI